MEANKLIQWAEKYHIDGILNIVNTHEALLNLKSLDLSHKKLETLPNFLFELSSLEMLNLSHNQLTELPQEITKLTNLTILDISWNHITHDINFLPSHVKIKKAWNRK